jgi:hypothetical protein
MTMCGAYEAAPLVRQAATRGVHGDCLDSDVRGEGGWDDYLLLCHFDPAVKRDAFKGTQNGSPG